jgi:hypothetical protein
VQGPQARLPKLHSKRYLPVGSVVQNIEFRALLAESGTEQLELSSFASSQRMSPNGSMLECAQKILSPYLNPRGFYRSLDHASGL